jgi:hypothetical protein
LWVLDTWFRIYLGASSVVDRHGHESIRAELWQSSAWLERISGRLGSNSDELRAKLDSAHELYDVTHKSRLEWQNSCNLCVAVSGAGHLTSHWAEMSTRPTR